MASFGAWYLVPTGHPPVVTVEGERITRAQLDQAVGEATLTTGAPVDPEVMLDHLIERAVLLEEAERRGITVSDTDVARALLAIPAFHDEEGRFSREHYEGSVTRLGLTLVQFEERVRDDLKIEQLSAEVVPDSPDRRAVVDWKQALIDAAEVERHPIP